MKEFAIIIPTLNNIGLVSGCLQAIKDTCGGLDYEVIVVGDDCKVETANYLKSIDIKHVALSGNQGFAKACNAGAKEASAKYLIFMNDDALPAVNWLVNLKIGFENFTKLVNVDGKPGCAGPLSNYVAGVQQLKSDRQLTQENRHAAARMLPKKVGITSFISGFCFFIPSEIFWEVEGWDERFFCGAEDNALCTKLLQKGYHAIAVGDSYVYHLGSQTLKRPEYQYLQGGVKNVPDYYRWYRAKDLNKLGVAYRVKIQNEYIKSIFLRSLKKSAEIADTIFILDDNSPIGWLEDVPKEVKDKIERRFYDRPFEERRDRNELINMVRDAKMDWMLCLDADEVLEDKVTWDYMRRLMNPIVPHIFAYKLHEYTFWNDETHYRVDAHWAKMAGIRLWRIQPNRQIRGGAKSTLHCEHTPILSHQCVLNSSIRIKHYGYVDPVERQRKCDWYEKIDTDKQEALIGNTNYSHIVDESDLRVRPWVEDSSLTITTMVKDEMTNIPEWLGHLWGFADEMLVCDTGSKDGTMEFLREAGVQIVQKPWEDHYAVPRNIALDTIGQKTTWVYQVDLDERVGDLSEIRRAMDYPIASGYMFYIRNMLKTGHVTFSETIRLFRTKTNWRYKGRVHETVDLAAKATPQFRIFRSPIDMSHSGYLLEDDKLKTKMLRYVHLSDVSMQENPEDPKPYYSLALHMMEVEEYESRAAEYLERAFTLDPKFYQPRKELGLLYLRRAVRLFKELKENILHKEHVDYQVVERILDATKPWAEANSPIPVHIREYFKNQGYEPKPLPQLKPPSELNPVTVDRSGDGKTDDKKPKMEIVK